MQRPPLLQEVNTAKGLELVASKEGLAAAKEAEKELQQNRFHPLGQIWQSMRRIEQMREGVTDAVKEATNVTEERKEGEVAEKEQSIKKEAPTLQNHFMHQNKAANMVQLTIKCRRRQGCKNNKI